MISKQEARSLIRKAVKRVPEGEEIRHLNIMPMMDMMTILLVAMIFQASTSNDLNLGNVELPFSRSNDKMPESAVTLTITQEAFLVDGEPVPGLPIKNGDVDASAREGGALGIKIVRLSEFLGRVRMAYEQTKSEEGKLKQGDNYIPELFVVADKATPYRLLFSVIASARAQEAGYRRFRLIVLEKGGASAAPSM